MNVKRHFLACLALFFSFSSSEAQAAGNSSQSAAAPSSNSTSSTSACNWGLLNQLRLTGASSGSAVAIDSCGISAADSCCSTTDEIKIVKSWNQFSLPKISKYNSDLEFILNRISELIPFVKSLDPNSIRYHHDNVAWRKTNETQCFNGKYFMEQTGYDMIKSNENLAAQILKEFIDTVATNLTAISPIVTREAVTKALEAAIPVTQAWDFCLLFQTPYLATWVANKSAEVTNQLANMAPPLVNLAGKAPADSPAVYVEKTLGILQTMTVAANKTSSQYYIQIVQTRSANIHISSLLRYVDTLTTILSKPPYSITNIWNATADIKDELFSDPVLRKYISWFILPKSVTNFTQMVDYTRNRVIKIFAEATLRSPHYSNSSHQLRMNQVMRAMAFLDMNTLLNGNICSIMASWVVHHRLPAIVEWVWKNGTLSKTDLYLLMARETFNVSDTLSTRTQTYAACGLDNHFKASTTRIFSAVQAKAGYPLALNATFKPDTAVAKSQLEKMSQLAASYSELSADGKQICAVVKKHTLIREAIFNPQKYAFCQTAVHYFAAQNISTVLKDIKLYKNQYADVLGLKKGLYCAACSKNMSKFIDSQSNTIALSNQFCLNFVQRFKPLYTWRSKTFSDYMNALYQYLRCFESGADLKDTYPYPLDSNVMPLPLNGWDSCLAVSSPENIADCQTFCTQFNVGKFTAALDGDRDQLRNMYNFMINTVRISGRRFSRLPTQDKKRILEEEPSWVQELVRPAQRRSRRLQAPAAAGNSSAPAAASNSSASGNSTAASSNATNSSNASASASVQTSGRATLTLYLSLAQNLDTLKEYTRPSHYNHDELSNAKNNYLPMAPGNSITQMVSQLKPQGIDLLAVASKSNFDITVLDSLPYKNLDISRENLSAFAIRDCVMVSNDDVKSMTSDFELIVEKTLPEVKPRPVLKHYADRKFATYKTKDLFRKRRLRRIVRSRNERRLKLRRQRPVRAKLDAKKERKATGNSITNFLFKLLF